MQQPNGSIAKLIECKFQKGVKLKWSTFVDGENGYLYGIPANATHVIKFNTTDKSVIQIGPKHEGGWSCGVRADNGKIYCAPNNCDRILIINTIDESVAYLDKSLPETGHNLWSSGVLAADGNIYFMPAGASKILKVNTHNETISIVGNELVEKDGVLDASSEKIGATIASKDGKIIYGIPFKNKRIIKYRLSNPGTTTRIGVDSDFEDFECWSAVLGPDGSTIYASNEFGKILKFDTVNDTYEFISNAIPTSGRYGWCEAIVGIDQNIYWPPYGANRVLKFNTYTQKRELIGDDLSGLGYWKWYSGTLASDDSGYAYFAPSNANYILQLDTSKGKTKMIDRELNLPSFDEIEDPSDVIMERSGCAVGLTKSVKSLKACFSGQTKSCLKNSTHKWSYLH